MLSLEMAIEKFQQLPPEQRNQAIQFIEFLDFQSSQAVISPHADSETEQAFFETAGLWENKEITTDSLRAAAWGEATLLFPS